MKPTMEEVAELAQVSRATVSRVLSDSTNVSPDKRQSVLKAVKKLGYEPLKQTNVRTPIAVASYFPKIWGSFYGKILEGIEQATTVEKFVIQHQAKDIQGLILLGNAKENVSNIPVVVVDGLVEDDGYSYVNIEERKVMLEVIQLLVKYGHRDIAFIGGPEHDIIRQERLRAYKLGILCARLSVNDNLIVLASDWDQQSGYYATKKLLTLASPTALVVANSYLALGAYKAIAEQGLKIPTDISIVGFDDLGLCVDLEPHMSTIAVPVHSMGKWATTILKGLIDDEKRCPVRLNIPAVFYQRQSVGRVNY